MMKSVTPGTEAEEDISDSNISCRYISAAFSRRQALSDGEGAKPKAELGMEACRRGEGESPHRFALAVRLGGALDLICGGLRSQNEILGQEEGISQERCPLMAPANRRSLTP